MKIITRSFLLFAILFSQLQAQSQDLLTTQAPLPCLNKEFTIVAHIVRDSFGMPNVLEADIEESIDSLNTFFSPICASFEICEFNYIDNFQYDTISDDRPEWEEMLVKYNRPRRINMYFVESQEGNPFCGFGSLNGVAETTTNVGILIFKQCAGPDFKTIPNEMGQFFNLLHTFEGSAGSQMPNAELVDGSNCTTAGDEICDTPADPYIPGDPVDSYVNEDENCLFIDRKRDADGEYFVPDVGNIMSYYPHACRCGFTYEQYLRMANAYLAAPDNLW